MWLMSDMDTLTIQGNNEAGKKSKKDITMLDATVPHQAEKIWDRKKNKHSILHDFDQCSSKTLKRHWIISTSDVF